MKVASPYRRIVASVRDRQCSSSIKKKDYPRAFAMAERARARTVGGDPDANAERSFIERRSERSDDLNRAVVALSQFETNWLFGSFDATSTEVVIRPLTRRDAQDAGGAQQDEISHGADDTGRRAATSTTRLFGRFRRGFAARLKTGHRS